MHVATLTIRARGCYGLYHALLWREFNLAIFYDSPNRQIKVLAKFSRYTVPTNNSHLKVCAGM